MPVFVTIALAAAGLVLALSHHGLAALVVGGALLAALIIVPFIDNAISAQSIARPRPRRPRPGWRRRR